MPQLNLSPVERKSLLRLARETLQAALTEQPDRPLKAFEEEDNLSDRLLENLPCFVTLTQKNGRLRGCVGCTVSYNSLYKNVYHFTRQAAFEDPRFEPVQEEEIAGLNLDITVLGPLQKLEDPSQIQIGKHGLYARFGGQSGLLLAQVATKNRWKTTEFMRQTCAKANLNYEDREKFEWFFFEEFEFSEH